jgi:hypothetical protein
MEAVEDESWDGENSQDKYNALAIIPEKHFVSSLRFSDCIWAHVYGEEIKVDDEREVVLCSLHMIEE